MSPFFLSGVVIFCSLLYSIGVAFNAPAGRERKILLLGWLPALAIILVAYVPFGIYNSGSAIRYASCFLLFLVFPSMLLSAASAAALEDETDAGLGFVARATEASPPPAPVIEATFGRIR